MGRFSAVGIIAMVLFTPFTATAGTLVEALGFNGTIYSISADETPSTFVTGQGGFCLAADSMGNLYVNNAAWTLSKITPADSETTYAFAEGTPPGVFIHGPNTLAFDAAGNLYSNNLADGTITETGSGGSPISTFVTGLNTPTDLAVDGAGNLYVSSSNDDLIYEITPDKSVSTFATGLTGALAFDSLGNLYVAGNGSISEIAPGGGISTFITDSGNFFGTLGFDVSGNLYAATQYDTILKITPSKTISTFATLPSFATDFVVVPEPSTMALFGSAAACLLLWRRRVARVRRCISIVGIAACVLLTPFTAAAAPMFSVLGLVNGTIYNVAADGSTSTFVTGQGVGLAMTNDSFGNLYVNNAAWTLSKITPAGSETQYAYADGITPPGVVIHGPDSLAFDAAGNLYSNNPADGTITVTAPGGSAVSTYVSGLDSPSSVAVDSSGDLFVSSPNADLIYKIAPDKTVTDFATGLNGDLALDSLGNLYVSGYGSIRKITPVGDVSPFITGQPDIFGVLAFDSAGNLYAATEFDTIIKFTSDGDLVGKFATLPVGITALVAAPVPEPSTMVLFGSAAACLLLWRRRSARRFV